MKKRLLSLLLCGVLLLSMLPVTALAADVPVAAADPAEQFPALTPGGIYWFDLSDEGIPGTVNEGTGAGAVTIPDTTLHWVPFTYTGTINAYKLTSAQATTEEYANQNKYDHSLFIADYAVTNKVSWDDLNASEKNMIFGTPYTSGGVSYTMRAPSAGSNSTGSDDSMRGTPQNNEWDLILDKANQDWENNDTGYIKNWRYMDSWGQDAGYLASHRAVRGYFSARYWDYDLALNRHGYVGFRPVLEILNPDTLTSDSLKVVTLNLNGGKAGTTDTKQDGPVNIVVKSGESFAASSGEGLTGPGGNVFGGWKTNNNLYLPGSAVPSTVTTLTAVWAGASELPQITTQPTDVTVTVGEQATFTVTASGGSNLIYQWQKNENGTWGNILGATEATCTINSTTAADAGQYRCVVINDKGGVVSNAATLTVQKATPTVTAPTAAQNLTYDGSAHDLISGGSTSGGELQYSTDNTNYSTTVPTGTDAGNYTVYYKVVGDDNYDDVTAQNVSVSIAKATPSVQVTVAMSGSAGAREAELTVTVTGVTGGAAPTGTVTLTNGNGLNEPLTLNSGTASYTWTGLADGDYTVMAAYNGDTNYDTASDTKTFDTSKQEQAALTISPVGNKSYGDPAFTLSASGGSGSGAVTFESSDPTVISISETTATIHKAGSATITASKAEDEDYNAATGTLSVTVGKKAVVFKANDKTVQLGGTMPTFDYAPVTLAYSDSITAEPTAACTATDTNTEGTFPITLSGAVLTNGDSYEISYQPGALTVTAQSTYTVTVNGGTGGGNYAAGDTVTITATVPSGQRFTGWIVNEGGVTLANASSATTTFTMPAQAVTVTANFQSNSGGGSFGGGGGGSYTPPTYPPTVERPSEGGGAAAISPSNPERGDTVTVTPKPDQGYEVDQITVTDQNGKPVEVRRNPDGTYTFTQPTGKVKIEVTYKPVQPIDQPWNNPFTDVSEGDWYYEAVRFVHERGLMNGYSDSRFGPNDPLSRAQLAQILFNKEGRPVVNYLMDFSDVADEAWYAEAIRWATSQGIVSGYGNGRFGPNDPITREQLAVMLWRYSGSPAATNKELHFNDTDEISGYALEAMRWAVENGILNGYGDGRLGPQGQATRAQVAQMLKNFIENQEENT